MKIIDVLHLMDHVGTFTIMTADVPLKGYYLTLVLKDRMPFDMELSHSIEHARKTHESMIATALVANEMLGLMGNGEETVTLPRGTVLN